MSTYLEATGLLCNIAGAILIFFFGVPAYPTREAAGQNVLLIEEDNPEGLAAVTYAERVSKLGLGLLIVGFVVQFLALIVR